MTLHLVGFALLAEAAGLELSALVAQLGGGRDVLPLVATGLGALVAGAVLWRGTTPVARVSRRQTFAAITWTWVVVCAVGAVPFVASGVLPAFDDAMFESVSGFTATGSTILAPIEDVSDGLLFWRSLTQWYGGMGMIVLAVAALPFLGVGGQQLVAAEAPGAVPDQLAPRVATTALRLWIIYVTITATTAVALLVAGTDIYDAVTHAFTAVSTGGFSRYDNSISHFDSIPVEVILEMAMLAGATNFALHWHAAHGDRGAYRRSSELRAFFGIIVGAVAVVTVLETAHSTPIGRALREGAFNVISVVTTTGFGLSDFGQWVPAGQLVLLALMFTGAMSGSTSGAIKIFRVQVIVRFARRELRRIRHPRAVLPVRHDGVAVPNHVLNGVVGFVMFYVLCVIAGVVVIAGFGSDLSTALGGVATAIGGIGPGLGDAGPSQNFLAFTHPARAVLAALMLVGRLEIYPVVLATLAGWRRVRDATTPRRTLRPRGRASRRPLGRVVS